MKTTTHTTPLTNEVPSEVYAALQSAYNSLNSVLFGKELPPVLFTLTRRPNSLGYYKPKAAINRERSVMVSEIAINPDYIIERSEKDVLSTLAHEMVHVKQDILLKHYPRNGYHDKEWANLMEAIGLQPTHNGLATGKKTGQHMMHLILSGGAFDKWFKGWGVDFKLKWGTVPDGMVIEPDPDPESENGDLDGQDTEKKKGRKKDTSKVRFSCLTHHVNVWAKECATVCCEQCLSEMFDKTIGIGKYGTNIKNELLDSARMKAANPD